MRTSFSLKHDVTDDEQWKNVVEQTESQFCPIDGLVNNAAVLGDPAPLESTTSVEFKNSLTMNTVSTFLGMKSGTPSMKKVEHCSIVNVSSQAGLVGNPNQIGYVFSNLQSQV